MVPKKAKRTKSKNNGTAGIAKSPSGIRGLDEITFGGLPTGRTTLVCGNAGCGKTLLGMEFLVRGAREHGEPGVCISFEETAEELATNVASLGLDVPALVSENKLAIDYVYVEAAETEETGEYDLEALFVRLGYAVETVAAKRVLIDGLEALFSGVKDDGILRAELRRLFRWLKSRGLTAVVTAERGTDGLTRHGIEEYVSDCVVLLDHRLDEAVSTRRLRVVKYRGTAHGTNEYPFLIDEAGVSVLPVTSLDLKHHATDEQISLGVSALDEMIAGGGIFRGSTVLISGTAGTGKTSLAAHFIDAACTRGERCVCFSFEESAEAIVRNVRSIGIDLARWVHKGLLRFSSVRPTSFGLETHLIRLHNVVSDFGPEHIVIDPISALLHSGSRAEATGMLLRIVDFLKSRGITAVMTSLAPPSSDVEQTDVGISSLVDTWILLRNIESGGERNRGLYILKARGLAHSNQVREFQLTDGGVDLRRVYVGADGFMTGSARIAQEAKDASEAFLVRQKIDTAKKSLETRRKALEAQILALRTQGEFEERKALEVLEQEQSRLSRLEGDRTEIATSRTFQATRDRADGARKGSRR